MTSETKEGSGVLKGLPLETWHLKSPEPTFWFGSIPSVGSRKEWFQRCRALLPTCSARAQAPSPEPLGAWIYSGPQLNDLGSDLLAVLRPKEASNLHPSFQPTRSGLPAYHSM